MFLVLIIGEEGLSAIIGFHDNKLMAISLKVGLEPRGYTRIDVVKTPEEMLERCQAYQYDVYLMDLNLGYPDSYNFTIAKEVRKVEEDRISKGEAKFFPMAARETIVEAAKMEGLPEAVTKNEFNRLYFDENILGKLQIPTKV